MVHYHLHTDSMVHRLSRKQCARPLVRPNYPQVGSCRRTRAQLIGAARSRRYYFRFSLSFPVAVTISGCRYYFRWPLLFPVSHNGRCTRAQLIGAARSRRYYFRLSLLFPVAPFFISLEAGVGRCD